MAEFTFFRKTQVDHLHVISNRSSPKDGLGNFFGGEPIIVTSSSEYFRRLLFTKRADVEIGFNWTRADICNLYERLQHQVQSIFSTLIGSFLDASSIRNPSVTAFRACFVAL